MITNQGCSSNWPGIGDIEYVKGLLTGNIATTTFRCLVLAITRIQKLDGYVDFCQLTVLFHKTFTFH